MADISNMGVLGSLLEQTWLGTPRTNVSLGIAIITGSLKKGGVHGKML